MRPLLVVLFSYYVSFASAQLPGFDIYLVKLQAGDNIALQPVNISNFTGYDNQPSFSPDGKYIYFTSIRDTIQSDIYKYDVEKKSLAQLTSTKESEYSPEITPDGKHVSVVRVEADSSQRLCLYNLKGEEPQLVMDTFQLIGYYGWQDQNHIAIFNLPEPFTLVYTDLATQRPKEIAAHVGRCIKKIPGEHAFSYVVKKNDSIWEIRKHVIGDMPPGTNATQDILITEIPNISEDYAWTPDGSMICMARGTQLYYFDYKGSRAWTPGPDLAGYNMKKIYRLAISPDGQQMVFVAEE